MPSLTQVRSVLAVNDLKRSVDFYRDKLGFSVELETDGWSLLVRDQVKLMLGHCPNAAPASTIGDHSWFAYVSVDGIDRCYDELKKRGVEIIQALANKPWGKREFGVVTPDGHRIVFGQDIVRDNVSAQQ